jgi:hypothetical protein
MKLHPLLMYHILTLFDLRDGDTENLMKYMTHHGLVGLIFDFDLISFFFNKMVQRALFCDGPVVFKLKQHQVS